MKAVSFSLLLLLAAPVVSPAKPKSDYKKPETTVSPDYKNGSGWREMRPLETLPRGAWWTVFKDATLNKLEARATAENQQLRAAVARFDQARATARVARGNFFPQANLGLDFNHQRTSQNAPSPVPLNGLKYEGGSFEVPLDLTYEIDLWGRVRRQYETNLEQAAAEAAAMQNVLLSLQADVAQNYFRLRALDGELATLREAVGWRKQWVDVVRGQVKAGAGNELEQAQAETEYASAQTEVASLGSQRAQLENAIAILCGADPSRFTIEPTGKGLSSPPAIPAGVPTDLLERRPDIAQAERLLVAANAQLGIAQRAWFPSLKLIATGGFLSSEISSLFESASSKWIIGPKVSLPIFSGGKNKANLERARAQYDEGLALYRQSILTALGDVENQLTALSHLSEQAAAQSRVLTSSVKAAGIARVQFDAGAGAYLNVIDTERTSLSARRGIHQVAGQRLIATVGLIKALGGGWHQSLPVVVPAQTPDPDAKSSPENKKPGLLKRLFTRKEKPVNGQNQ
ncbi:MAG TPA: efflux transporter outer membrane subunit [Verrucomicrobiales bacterium]|nr:efflux transporter outer membrane subunit [Verrucomicrobiales bacterium]